jgi:hypothetical protein
MFYYIYYKIIMQYRQRIINLNYHVKSSFYLFMKFNFTRTLSYNYIFLNIFNF